MKNEKSLLTNCEYLENGDGVVSFYKTKKGEKRNEKMKNEKEWQRGSLLGNLNQGFKTFPWLKSECKTKNHS